MQDHQRPMAAIPAELVEQLDRVENRCSHIEKKVDVLDTQVLRDSKS